MNIYVTFDVGDTKIQTVVGKPTRGTDDEEGLLVITVNNAVEKVKKDLGLDLRELIDVYEQAEMSYVG